MASQRDVNPEVEPTAPTGSLFSCVTLSRDSQAAAGSGGAAFKIIAQTRKTKLATQQHTEQNPTKLNSTSELHEHAKVTGLRKNTL